MSSVINSVPQVVTEVVTEVVSEVVSEPVSVPDILEPPVVKTRKPKIYTHYEVHNGRYINEEVPSSVKGLYDRANKVYMKKYNRYVKNWFDAIMEAGSKGKFETTLYVCDWDCEEGEPHEVVNDAVEKIKRMFHGINIEEKGDSYCPYYNASWNIDDVEACHSEVST